MLRLYGIERHGRITAVQLGFLHRRRAFAYAGGFDPEDAQVSLGTLLTAHAIMEAQREGCRWFDFLKGDEAHKLSWGAKRQEAFRRGGGGAARMWSRCSRAVGSRPMWR